MNISMKWLKDYVNPDVSTHEFCDAMTMSGSKVEMYKDLGAEISNVVVGRILEISKHPDADKLQVCKVDVGNALLQIVTGANNISVDDLVPVALHGSTLAGGVKITKGKLRGVDSEGMLCSIEELGFDKADFADAPEHGIYIIKGEFDSGVGTDIKPILGLDDSLVEFEITSNRQDCFSIVGIAREASATFNKSLSYPKLDIKEAGDDINKYISIKVENTDLCRRYIGRVVKNIKIGPSPIWMQQRLRTVGIRPINNIVDITNYVMVEIGQPMHAFDLDYVEDKKIIVKTASKGDKFITLDGVERTLDDTTIMICDGKKPVGIGGIMGGENSKITENTKTILFEAANFNGTNIRVNSKKLGLRTDASGKFEKDLDPNLAEIGMNRALHLIEELGAGEVVSGKIDVYPNKRVETIISYSTDRINKFLGINISEEEMVRIFEKLEFKVDRANKKLTIPTFRQDVLLMEDVAEEVARIYGYNNIETTLITAQTTVGKVSETQTIINILKNILEAQGLSEGLSYAFESPKALDKLNIPQDSKLRTFIKVSNPLGEDYSAMRTQTMNAMLTSISNNYNKRNKEAYLYDISKVYRPNKLPLTELPTEETMLTIGMYGNLDFYSVKGIVEEFSAKLGIKEEYTTTSEIAYMHPGRTANVIVDGKVIGYIGEVHPEVALNYDIETKVYVACISVDELVKLAKLVARYKPLPKYPSVGRDIAVVLKDDIEVRQIENIIRINANEILESVQLFDMYKGNQIGEGMKSVAYNIILRAADKTLTEEEVNIVMSNIIKDLEVKLEAKLR